MKNLYNNVRLNDDDDYRREELIRKIEDAVKHLSTKELEALAYDMFTRGYIDEI